MITQENLRVLNPEESSYLYYCCNKEFEEKGYVYFDFSCIKIFTKQNIKEIVHKHSDYLNENKRDIPEKIIKKLEEFY